LGLSSLESLLAEDALGAGRRQVALLRCQPGGLIRVVDVLAYPTIMVLRRLGVRFASWTV
jgi:hypothetical protein